MVGPPLTQGELYSFLLLRVFYTLPPFGTQRQNVWANPEGWASLEKTCLF
jgi:hypothetical protein